MLKLCQRCLENRTERLDYSLEFVQYMEKNIEQYKA